METIHWLVAGLAALLVGLSSAGACVLFFNRRIDELMRRLSKAEKARQTAMQHGMQARTQVDMLQKELAELQRMRALQVRNAQQERREELDLVLATADRNAAAAAASSFVTRGPLPKSGFADTMPV